MTKITTGGSGKNDDDGPSNEGECSSLNSSSSLSSIDGSGGGGGGGGSGGGGSVAGGCFGGQSDRWKLEFGSNDKSMALYQICLGLVLCVELVSRFKYLHPFYSDKG
jgi:hypothetical protein